MKCYLIQIPQRPPRSPSKVELEIVLLTIALLLIILLPYFCGGVILWLLGME